MKRDLIKTAEKLTISIALTLCISQFSSAKLSELQDSELNKITGQSLFSMSYIAPTEPGNSSNLGFYTLGLEATLELNANIRRVQLGCGGVNGADQCDIDLERVRLTGLTPGPSGTYADSDAVLDNPFIQFAVKNPNSASTRSVVGVALGAQTIVAQMSVGENPTPDIAGTPGGTPGGETGANVISGRLPAQVSHVELASTLCTRVSGSNCIVALGDGNLPLLNTTVKPRNGVNQPNGVFSSLVTGNRMTNLKLGPFGLDAAPLDSIGGVFVSALGGVAYGTLDENFIDIHNLNISSNKTSGFLLTLNQQDILWPQMGTSGTSSFPTPSQFTNSHGSTITEDMLLAKRGWFLIFPGVSLGGTPEEPLVTSRVLLGVLNNPSALQVLSYPGITIPSINLRQIPTHNCYGSLKFC